MKMFFLRLIVLFIVWSFLGCSQTECLYGFDVPVFPGAQGFGIMTPAGRGGVIIRVTNLGDDGEGSLRSAIETTAPRIIVFEVAGTIELSRDLVVNAPFLTIAGQTAPAPGITIKGAGLAIRSHDVLVQHIRVRVGDKPNEQAYPTRDALSIIGPEVHDVVIDHVSASWAIDENVSTWFKVKNVTISNSIISEGLHRSRHNKGPHSKGVLLGDYAENVALLRNYIAHNHDRYPLIKGGSSVAIVNNLNYNSGTDEYIEVADPDNHGLVHVSVVGNVYLDGDNTPAKSMMLKVHKSVKPGSKVFLEDNLYEGMSYHSYTGFDPRVFVAPVWPSTLTVLPTSKVKKTVASCAGARPVDRDDVDRRVVQDLLQLSGKIIDSQDDIGGWPDLPTNRQIFALPQDPNSDADCDGYSNIEELIHQMALRVEGKDCNLLPGLLRSD